MTICRCKIKVRGYEIGPDLRLPSWAYLRYMEQLRWASREASTLNVERFFRAGYHLVVVAQHLWVERYCRQAEVLQGTLNISRVGRTSADFHHEFSGEGGPVARGIATVVHVGPDGKPAPFPQSMHELVQADLPPVPSLEPGERPEQGVFVRPLTVRHSDTDLLSHVNHANYLIFFEDTRQPACRAGAYGEAHPGCAPHPGQVTLIYRRQALFGEAMEAATWAQSPKDLAFELHRAGDPGVYCRGAMRFEARPMGS